MSHGLEAAGAVVIRGDGRIAGPGRVVVTRRRDGRAARPQHHHRRRLAARRCRPIEGLEHDHALDEPRGHDHARAAREPGGPRRRARRAWRWPRSSPATASRRPSSPPSRGSTRRATRATRRRSRAASAATASTSGPGSARSRVRARARTAGAHVIDLADGTSVEGHEVMLAVGRTLPLAAWASRPSGVDLSGGALTIGARPPDRRRRLRGRRPGRPRDAHPRRPLPGRARRPHRARRRCPSRLPRHPARRLHGPRGRRRRALARGGPPAGHDAFEEVADLATSAKGYVVEAGGHVTIVVDRASRTLSARSSPGRPRPR